MNSFELTHVTRDQRQIMHQCDRSNLQIERTNHAHPLLKIMANDAITLRATIIEGQRNCATQGNCEIHFSGIGIVVFFRAMHEFSTNGRTCRQLFGGSIGEFSSHPEVFTFENFNPNIGVEQVARYQVLAGGNGRSGGRSNSLSAQAPIICAKSGRRRLTSSKVGRSSSFSTSEIASRTFDSSTFAFSGSRRSKVRSSSNAMVVTTLCCHAISQNSTSHFQTP